MSLRERLAFLSQMLADFHHTGAVQPSSRHLAAAMTAPLRADDRPARRIVEIGPGTGSVTRAIVAALGPRDRLDCFEINPAFVEFLERRFRREPGLAAARDRVTIHNAPAQQLRADEPVHFVVCSAPLNNFDREAIDAIFDAGFDALVDDGTFTFFEYAFLPALRRAVTFGAARRHLDDARRAKQRRLDEHATTSTLVVRNLPPARAHHLRRDGSGAS